MNNYHIVVDHAFVRGFLSDVKQLGLIENNFFLVRGNQEEANFLRPEYHVEWVGNNYVALAERLNNLLQPDDIVFLHWCDLPLSTFVLNLKPSANICNFHWGGELLEEPYLYHVKRNYATKTLQFVINEQEENNIANFRKKNLPFFPFYWLYKLKLANKTNKEFIVKQKTVQRFKYMINNPANTGDDRLIRKMYNHPNLISVPTFYDVNFDLAASESQNIDTTINRPIKILLNNAAHYSGNHLDAIELLAKRITISQYQFNCPLSYCGTPKQIAAIIASGNEKLDKSFLPITELMPRETYVKFLSSMDILFMYQNISQGFGNIITALTQGKPVFLRKVNSLTEMLNNLGIKVYDADAITDELIQLSIQEAQLNAESNKKKLMQHFSEEIRHRYLKNLLLRVDLPQ